LYNLNVLILKKCVSFIEPKIYLVYSVRFERKDSVRLVTRKRESVRGLRSMFGCAGAC